MVFLWTDVWEMTAEIPYCHGMSLPRSGQCFWLVVLQEESTSTNQMHCPQVWVVMSHQDGISLRHVQGNYSWGHEMLVVSSGHPDWNYRLCVCDGPLRCYIHQWSASFLYQFKPVCSGWLNDWWYSWGRWGHMALMTFLALPLRKCKCYIHDPARPNIYKW